MCIFFLMMTINSQNKIPRVRSRCRIRFLIPINIAIVLSKVLHFCQRPTAVYWRSRSILVAYRLRNYFFFLLTNTVLDRLFPNSKPIPLRVLCCCFGTVCLDYYRWYSLFQYFLQMFLEFVNFHIQGSVKHSLSNYLIFLYTSPCPSFGFAFIRVSE